MTTPTAPWRQRRIILAHNSASEGVFVFDIVGAELERLVQHAHAHGPRNQRYDAES